MKTKLEEKLIATNHKKPVTRREFLGLGFGQATGLLMMPTLFDVFFEKMAYGFDCPPTTVSNDLPFLLFDCAGGAGLSGNWVVGKQGGSQDYLKSYNQMGVPKSPAQGEAIDAQFGAPFYKNYSKIYEGILANTSAATRNNTQMATICNSSQDDSQNNLLSPAVLVSQAGLRGKYLSFGISNFKSASGGNSKGPMEQSSLRPLAITKVEDLLNSVSYGPILSAMHVSKRKILGETLLKVSKHQSQKFSKEILGEEAVKMAQCTYADQNAFAESPSDLDPRKDVLIQEVFKTRIDGSQLNVVASTIASTVLKRQSGPGIITIPGCDYHDGTQNTGDAKDLEIGNAIGRSLELASRLKQPLFFAVVSDGSVYSDPDTRRWRGDAGIKGLAVMGYYNPNEKPKTRRTQIGHYTNAQGVERSTYIGAETKRVAYAIFANYLYAGKRLTELEKFIRSNEFETAQIDSHLFLG